MLLQGENSSLELDILGYDNESNHPLDVDRNQLLIGLIVKWRHNVSTRVGPILLTWELVAFYNWLISLEKPQLLPHRVSFHEPSFRMECLSLSNDEYVLQVYTQHEMAPDWHYDVDEPFRYPIIIAKSELERAASELKSELARFPIR